jgi:hypothetical protein
MKILFAVLGILSGIIAVSVDTESRLSSPLGIYILASAFILAAALYQGGQAPEQSFSHFQEVIAVLAQGPLPMNELLKQLADLNPQYENSPDYQRVLGEMFANQHLIIRGGQVDIANRGENTNL